MTQRPEPMNDRRAETAYTVRYWRGPLDGGEEQIICGYPPKTLHGYQLSHSMNGRYYLYAWPRCAQGADTGGQK